MVIKRKRSAEIKNKAKRIEVREREKAEKKVLQREKKRKRQKELVRESGDIGEEISISKRPRTLENTREAERTLVTAQDLDDVAGDEHDDEFSEHPTPKILITTRPRPSKELFRFIADLMTVFPNSLFYPRRNFSVKQVSSFASNKKFTHLIVLMEKNKKCNALLLSHIPLGPTAFFKVSNIQTTDTVPKAGRKTKHNPEVILNNFSTRLGRRTGRFLASLFSHQPQFTGRQVVTFHNQRDYIFVRHNRYIFEENTKHPAFRRTLTADSNDGNQSVASSNTSAVRSKPTSIPAGQKAEPVVARLQELGPRFTLRLRWLQDGTFDPEHGEYEWYHRRKQMDTSRRKFHL
uniref:Brix domain-containing protein n=1 Tax=Aureoumbra lagunensis TaxID=44058 RepID=A0A7S3JUJ2_9STRA|mmetsp:Transcript_21468/g.27794  ORF Transcript_21468/g.27794 Transcript_21468/m.27794 type:complete len:348 (-) Transcript_21468:102-1145(-)